MGDVFRACDDIFYFFIYDIYDNYFINYLSQVPANETVIYDVEVLNITRGTEKRNGLLFNKMFHFEDLDKVENCALKVQGRDIFFTFTSFSLKFREFNVRLFEWG